jgi:enoyl-CoA hydratase/carnithine racemase
VRRAGPGLAGRAEAEVAAEARKLALEIAANAPLAVQASKRLMRMGLSEGFDEHVHHVFLQLLPLLKRRIRWRACGRSWRSAAPNSPE